jgi:hypothetical protein
MPSMASPPDIRMDSYPTMIGYFNRKPPDSPIDVLWPLAVVAKAGLHPRAGFSPGLALIRFGGSPYTVAPKKGRIFWA